MGYNNLQAAPIQAPYTVPTIGVLMQTQMQQDRAKTRSAKFSEVMHPSSLNYLESDFFFI